jgi:hypothetical protein
MSKYFHLQKVENIKHFKNIVKLRLHDQLLQDWHSNIDTSSKCLVYRTYKNTQCYEKKSRCIPI